MTVREHKYRLAENLCRPQTVMADAFLEALRQWAMRRGGDTNTKITIPSGTVDGRELARVVLALIAIQKSPVAGKPVDQS